MAYIACIAGLVISVTAFTFLHLHGFLIIAGDHVLFQGGQVLCLCQVWMALVAFKVLVGDVGEINIVRLLLVGFPGDLFILFYIFLHEFFLVGEPGKHTVVTHGAILQTRLSSIRAIAAIVVAALAIQTLIHVRLVAELHRLFLLAVDDMGVDPPAQD
jgi:hypothetical protein